MVLGKGFLITVIGPKDPAPAGYINTTSRSTNWSRELSPFFLGPIELYGGHVAQNCENAWQFTKVYPNFLDEEENPTPEYFAWAAKGWADTRAHRYPMGKGSIPAYSWWDGRKLSYIEARKEIYIPLYAKAVQKTSAFQRLKKMYQAGEDIVFFDFDAYLHRDLGMSYQEVMDCPTRKMGHAFVIAMLLEGVNGYNNY